MNSDYLAGAVARKRGEVAALRQEGQQLKKAALASGPARPWASVLRRPDRVTLIAEFKRRAPSVGVLRGDLDPAELACTYERAGAVGLSVLTDLDFDGTIEDLVRARSAVSLPVLRKDFIVDPLQVWQSRAAGADAVLLIVRALSDGELQALLEVARELGVGTLVEIHEERELERALRSGAPVIGINNRDLIDFTISLDVTHRLAETVPADRVLVAESGIDSAEEVRDLGALGVDSVLVGRALVSHPAPLELARSMATQGKRARG